MEIKQSLDNTTVWLNDQSMYELIDTFFDNYFDGTDTVRRMQQYLWPMALEFALEVYDGIDKKDMAGLSNDLSESFNLGRVIMLVLLRVREINGPEVLDSFDTDEFRESLVNIWQLSHLNESMADFTEVILDYEQDIKTRKAWLSALCKLFYDSEEGIEDQSSEPTYTSDTCDLDWAEDEIMNRMISKLASNISNEQLDLLKPILQLLYTQVERESKMDDRLNVFVTHEMIERAGRVIFLLMCRIVSEEYGNDYMRIPERFYDTRYVSRLLQIWIWLMMTEDDWNVFDDLSSDELSMSFKENTLDTIIQQFISDDHAETVSHTSESSTEESQAEWHDMEHDQMSGLITVDGEDYQVVYWTIDEEDIDYEHYLNVFIDDSNDALEIMRATLRGANEIEFSLSNTSYGVCQGKGKIVGVGGDGIEITNLDWFWKS